MRFCDERGSTMVSETVNKDAVPRMVMTVEMSSCDLKGLESACSSFIAGMKQVGHSYGGPISLPKQRDREKGTIIHTRVFEIETNERVAVWLKNFSPGDSVAIRCKVVERR